MEEKFTNKVEQTLAKAIELAKNSEHRYVDIVHYLKISIDDSSSLFVSILNKLNISINSLKKEITEDLEFTRELEKDYTVPSHKVGEVVTIDSSKDFEKQDNQLHRAFRVGYKNTPKVLVKTRNNQIKK